MKYQIARLSIIACLLVCILPTTCRSDSTPSGATYYVDANHTQARDSANYGSIDRPWKTPRYAFQQLEPGDTLLIRGGTYTRYPTTLTERNSGQQGAPITVKAYPGETVIFKGGNSAIDLKGADWWTFEGLVFTDFTSHCFLLGRHKALDGQTETLLSTHITIRNCEFKNGNRAVIRLNNANDVLIEGCYFHHVRPGIPSNQGGHIVNAISVSYTGNNIVFKGCRFEDIGSDGIQLGTQAYLPGSDIRAVSILDCEFWVNRPYTGILGNVGENGIDIKNTKGPVLISGNIIHGFRPTIPGQDALINHWGDGLLIHDNARNIIVERNLLYDNTIHLVIARGSDGTNRDTRDIIVRNNIFRQARGEYAVRVSKATNISLYHNTFYDNEESFRSYEVSGGVFKNNVIIGGKLGISNSAEWKADYNAWVGIKGRVPSRFQGNHDLWIDDPALDSNLHPLSDSPLIDAGQDVGVLDDFNGTLRSDGLPDLGAIEYNSSLDK
jgi:hypothetical protein